MYYTTLQTISMQREDLEWARRYQADFRSEMIEMKRAQTEAAPSNARPVELLALVFAFGAGGGMFHTTLRLGFVHGSLVFLGTFGTGLGAFLAFFVQHFFAAEELDEGVVGAVTLPPAGANDAQVTAVAVSKARTDGVEELVDGGTGHQKGEGLTARGQVAALTESDHLFDQRSHGLGFGDGGLYALFNDQRSD